MHYIENGRLMFNNSSIEEGDHLRDELAPQTYRIRQNIGNLLEELYNIKYYKYLLIQWISRLLIKISHLSTFLCAKNFNFVNS